MFTTQKLSPQEQTDQAAKKLQNVYSDEKLEKFLPLILKINQLKQDKNALLLGHNYMHPEVFHGVSDIVGDSYALAKEARDTHHDIILFNGVYFMAESAKILNPEKKVLIADPSAGCSLADGITAQDVIQLKKEHPGAPVVTYINSSAEVKAESDIICTSSNALKIVESLSDKKIIFLPDKFLAANVALMTDKEIVSFTTACEVHEKFSAEDVDNVRKRFPAVPILAHPECSTEVTTKVDFTGSTSQMLQWIMDNPEEKKIMLITECSMGANIIAETGDREFIGPCQLCPHMQKITLDKILDTLENEKNEVHIKEEMRKRALKSLNRMLELV